MTTIITEQRRWRVLGGSRANLYGQVGLRLVDELTGVAPLGRVRSKLYISDGSGGWRLTGIKAITTASGVLAYPKLERRAVVAGQLARSYRVQIEAEFYRPFYRASSDGIEFDVFPYNDENPPQTITQMARDVTLVPATNYPFPSHIPVFRGVVMHAGATVVDAEVRVSLIERVVTDERGAFSLPVRWKAQNVPFSIDAIDNRTGRTGSIPVKIPNDLGKNKIIPIS
ncbi:MAG TPA: hypothetical protein VK619_09475 [Pyrinomonadaceae bacterium]|nr:hypothetical protein [Pyrinomonadaceae bacterium]